MLIPVILFNNKNLHMDVTCPNWDLESWIASEAYIAYAANVLSECLQIKSESRILDIGCGRANITIKLATSNILKHPIEGIDISETIHEAPTHSGVILFQTEALTYLKNKPDAHYDGIILKQVFHCIDTATRKPLLWEIRRCLKPNGRALVLMMPPEITIPMFTQGQDSFRQEQIHYQDVVALGQGCQMETQLTHFSFNVEIAKQHYFELLRQRFMSNLRNLSDGVIEAGIAELDNRYHEKVLKFEDRMYIVHLIKPAA